MKEYRFNDIKINMTEKFTIQITNEMIEIFSKLCGDINPLHVNADYAKEKGFKDKVVHGMMTASFYSTLVGIYLPGRYSLLQGLNITFNSPSYAEDILEIKGEVSYINEAYRQIEIDAYICNQNGKKISKAKIKVGFYE